jgi:hypothetical protein
MTWYTYEQNNSGGSFTGPALLIAVEAGDPGAADSKAVSVGAYFNGCEDGSDCPCCGDRWHEAYSGRDESPVTDGGAVDSYLAGWWFAERGYPFAITVDAAGTKRAFVIEGGVYKEVPADD